VGVTRAAAVLALAAALGAAPALAATPDEQFQAANDLVRAGDYPKAIEAYASLAAAGEETASLYWNWAQAATARGASGEALWALLRARELDPSDRAVARDVERLREALNLDPAEIAPEPLAAAGRFSRRFRLDLLAVLLLAGSLVAHAVSRLGRGPRRTGALAGALAGLGLLAALPPVAGSFARPTATVVHRAAPLFESASPAAEPTGQLREGEVVPVLGTSGEWLRVEDNAGARGWARASDVRRLDRAPKVGE
jgi:hypothetical protein